MRKICTSLCHGVAVHCYTHPQAIFVPGRGSSYDEVLDQRVLKLNSTLEHEANMYKAHTHPSVLRFQTTPQGPTVIPGTHWSVGLVLMREAVPGAHSLTEVFARQCLLVEVPALCLLAIP